MLRGWTRQAIVVGLVASGLTACIHDKPRVHKGPDEAAKRWKTGQVVEEGIDKQVIPAAAPGRRAGAAHVLDPGEAIWMQSGKSRVLQLDHAVTRVSIGDPDLAGVVVLGPKTILVNAKELPEKGGTESNVGVTRGPGMRFGVLSPKTLTPEPKIAETTIILWDGAGKTDSHTVIIADFLGEQVMLEVTVAELNRSAMEERGIDFRQISDKFSTGYWLGGSGLGPQPPGFLTTEPPTGHPQFPLIFAPQHPQFAFNLPNQQISAFINALQTEGLATVLAQPKLVALSGQNAVFQVGGEIPIRIVTSFVADIEFKPFGTLVNFLPRITEEGDIILTVTPEVSQPDFQSPVEGIPTFRTRRASTSARLHEGETLVIGGLVQNQRREEERGIPYLKDVPYIGYVFRNTLYIDETTELLVVVTPHLVHGMPGQPALALPSDRPPLTRGDVSTQPDPAEVTRPRAPVPGAPKPYSDR